MPKPFCCLVRNFCFYASLRTGALISIALTLVINISVLAISLGYTLVNLYIISGFLVIHAFGTYSIVKAKPVIIRIYGALRLFYALYLTFSVVSSFIYIGNSCAKTAGECSISNVISVLGFFVIACVEWYMSVVVLSYENQVIAARRGQVDCVQEVRNNELIA